VAAAVSHGRRALLRGRAPGAAAPPLRPPWAAPGFEQACTRCERCLEACPERILAPGDGGLPQVFFARGSGECTFCGACAEACPEPAFDRHLRPAWHARAVIDDTCFARSGVHCQTCADACAQRAIRFHPVHGLPPVPRVDRDACTGCGACVQPCPAGAIRIAPARAHHG